MTKKFLILTAVATLFLMNVLYTQTLYNIVPDSSTLNIEGTSTLHDWHMSANDFRCEATIDFNALKNEQIKDVHFKCESEKILSDKSLMDSKAHKALKTDKYPDIEFVFQSAKYFENKDGNLKGEISGLLKLSGETKPVELVFTGRITDNTGFEVNGRTELNMKNFGISPPIFMFGAVKTGEVVTLKYHFLFKAAN